MERDLVIRAQHGDREAFSELAHRMGGRLLGTAQRIMRDADAAEDATQQALVQIWRKLPRLREPDRFDGWAYRILVNECRTEARRNRRRATVSDAWIGHPEMRDPAMELADRDELERAFRKLGVDHRAILVMQHYLDLTLEQCAQMLGIPLGTARSRSHHAKRQLRAAVEADARPTADPRWTA